MILIPSVYQEYDIIYSVTVDSITVMDKFIIIITSSVFQTDYIHNVIFWYHYRKRNFNIQKILNL